MSETTLHGCRILIVEDEYVLAFELQDELREAGADVLGPFAKIEDAMRLLATKQRVDGAVLDINLGGQWVYPVADVLIERQVPFVFVTGYDATSVPDRFARVVCCEKPVPVDRVKQAISAAVQAT